MWGGGKGFEPLPWEVGGGKLGTAKPQKKRGKANVSRRGEDKKWGRVKRWVQGAWEVGFEGAALVPVMLLGESEHRVNV